MGKDRHGQQSRMGFGPMYFGTGRLPVSESISVLVPAIAAVSTGSRGWGSPPPSFVYPPDRRTIPWNTLGRPLTSFHPSPPAGTVQTARTAVYARAWKLTVLCLLGAQPTERLGARGPTFTSLQ